jgi:hypothetical protein
MGRDSKTKAERRLMRSGIKDHKQQGKTLTPPMAAIPNLQLTRWSDRQLPELLWCALLVSNGPREDVLQLVRGLSDVVHGDDPNWRGDVTLSGIAAATPEMRLAIVSHLSQVPEAATLLAPLLLFSNLPARDAWEAALPAPGPDAWDLLAIAVAHTLDHQSQEATDCQWAEMLCLIAGNGVGFTHESQRELFDSIVQYPNFGDQRKVRPGIRAMSRGMAGLGRGSGSASALWAEAFWANCLQQTACFPLSETAAGSAEPQAGTTLQTLRDVRAALIRHWKLTLKTSDIDPRHDTCFGIALYALSLLDELIAGVSSATNISARMALRAIMEAFVTLAYLLKKDDPALWRSYRVFGSGQAKLSLLKLENVATPPTSISGEQLEQLANEDMWQEYLSIDLGHWTNSNLRNLATDAGVKDVYDKFYSWTSVFAHGHWAAIRAVAFDTCGNPLHRLHRIPREDARRMPDVVPDATELGDRVLELLSRAYPTFGGRLQRRE